MIQVQLKLQLRPAQERQLGRWLFRLTGAYNWALRKIEADAAHGRFHTRINMLRFVNGHGRKIGVSQDALNGAVTDAHDAWARCFQRRTNRPRMKGLRNRLNSISFPHGSWLRMYGRYVAIPVLGRTKFHQQEIPVGRVGAGRIVRRASGWL